LRAQLGLSEIVDTISSAQGLEVRVPARMSSNVLKALEFGIMTQDQAAKKLRISPAQLRGELKRRRQELEDE